MLCNGNKALCGVCGKRAGVPLIAVLTSELSSRDGYNPKKMAWCGCKMAYRQIRRFLFVS